MPLYTKIIPTQPNDQVTNDRIISLAKKQNLVFERVVKGIVPGVTTADLADIARVAAMDAGIELWFRSKSSFPDDISVCRNHEIMNGIPNRNSVIREGDVVKLAIGTNESTSAFCVQNWTVIVESEKNYAADLHLMSATMKCLDNAVKVCTPNTKISTIVNKLHEIARAENIVLSSSFVGNLIGKEPIIQPIFVLPKGMFGKDYTLSVGTMFSLLALGHPKKPQEKIAENKWTVVERNRFRSAAFSHVILIGANGPEVLTSTYDS